MHGVPNTYNAWRSQNWAHAVDRVTSWCLKHITWKGCSSWRSRHIRRNANIMRRGANFNNQSIYVFYETASSAQHAPLTWSLKKIQLSLECWMQCVKRRTKRVSFKYIFSFFIRHSFLNFTDAIIPLNYISAQKCTYVPLGLFLLSVDYCLWVFTSAFLPLNF